MRLGWIDTVLIMVAYCMPIFILFVLDDYLHLSIFEMALAISLSLKLVGSFNTFISSTVRLQQAIVSFGRIEFFLENVQTESIHRKPFNLRKNGNVPVLRLTNVEKMFGTRQVINKVNLEMEKFSKIGILGGSGCGKHILSKLIMQIYDSYNIKPINISQKTQIEKSKRKKPDEKVDQIANLFNKEAQSKIELYGIDLATTNPRNVRQEIRYLSKLPITFSGSVRDNIDPGFKYSD